MKKIKLFTLSSFLFVMHTFLAMQSPVLEKLAQKHCPPAHVIKCIEKNKKRIMELRYDRGNGQIMQPFGYLKECPDVYFKGTRIDRLVNAERMRKCIEQYNLKLKVIRKYIYNIDGTWIVLADRVDVCHDSFELTLQECQDIYELAKRTAYFDWNFTCNWMRDTQGALVCCDTENGSFCKETSSFKWVYNYLHECIGMFWNTIVTDQKIIEYAQQKKEDMKGFEGRLTITPLHEQTQYDDPELDFEEVKKLLKI